MNIMVIYIYNTLGWGQMRPLGPILFSESLIFGPTAHFLQDFHFRPGFIEIVLLVLEKKIFEWFLPYMGMAAILVSDLDYIYIHIGNPFLLMLHIKFGFVWPSGFRGDV